MKEPAAETLWRAIDIYLKCAYDRTPPRVVQERLDTLRALTGEDLYRSTVFERGQGPEWRLSLRLGNRCYPHMKLVIESAPDGQGCLFRADTHDRHALPEPGTIDHEAFRELMAHNEAIAQAIEAAWVHEGLATFKQFLLADLERRKPG